ncbi:MAG: hypothetical protein KC414_13275 [Romboutsia sp.]|nr:hypothetical protein [Romboutsia sp.]
MYNRLHTLQYMKIPLVFLLGIMSTVLFYKIAAYLAPISYDLDNLPEDFTFDLTKREDKITLKDFVPVAERNKLYLFHDNYYISYSENSFEKLADFTTQNSEFVGDFLVSDRDNYGYIIYFGDDYLIEKNVVIKFRDDPYTSIKFEKLRSVGCVHNCTFRYLYDGHSLYLYRVFDNSLERFFGINHINDDIKAIELPHNYERAGGRGFILNGDEQIDVNAQGTIYLKSEIDITNSTPYHIVEKYDECFGLETLGKNFFLSYGYILPFINVENDHDFTQINYCHGLMEDLEDREGSVVINFLGDDSEYETKLDYCDVRFCYIKLTKLQIKEQIQED